MRLKGAWGLCGIFHGQRSLFGAGVAGFLARAGSFFWACFFIVAIPVAKFKVNISDGIGEQVQSDSNRDKQLSTSGIWPFIEYTQYKKLLASKDQLGNS